MSHVQGLIALSRGELGLAARRLREAEAGWRRRAAAARVSPDRDSAAGDRYVAALIDLGRPPIAGLVDPDRELAALARTSPRWEGSMPEFEDHARSEAPPEDVWKLLYDPGRFPDWWAGIGSVEQGRRSVHDVPEGYPDFPMPQQLRVGGGSGVTISCLVSDLVFEWLLAPLDDGLATSITVHVEIPETEVHRLADQQDVVSRSLTRLAALAAAETR